MSRKEIIDAYVGKLLSRKLLVFIISTVALFTGQIDADNFVIISSAYVGVEGFIDGVARLKGIKNT